MILFLHAQCYGLRVSEVQNSNQIIIFGNNQRVHVTTLFKDVFNPSSIAHMGQAISQVWSNFDQPRFIALASYDLSRLEMKARSNQIVSALDDTLPSDFKHATKILIAALAPVHDIDTDSSGWTNNLASEEGIGSWLIMPCADYIALHGINETIPENFALSMEALHAMTKLFSAEFAIRPFIASMPEQTFAVLQQWVFDSDKHVRRLVSEGSRPRLPWGIRLQAQVLDPTPTLIFLEQLKNDPEEYVRLSVSNHLNDIAKDHPDVVNGIAQRWLNEMPSSPQLAKLVKHACRTLIKQGNRSTLAIFGYADAEVDVTFTLVKGVIKMGGSVQLECVIHNPTKSTQALLVDYVVYHQKANGSTSPKVFKWKQLQIPPGATETLYKQHSFKPVTTRTYYPGEHRFEIQINGQSCAQTCVHLRSGL